MFFLSAPVHGGCCSDSACTRYNASTPQNCLFAPPNPLYSTPVRFPCDSNRSHNNIHIFYMFCCSLRAYVHLEIIRGLDSEERHAHHSNCRNRTLKSNGRSVRPPACHCFWKRKDKRCQPESFGTYITRSKTKWANFTSLHCPLLDKTLERANENKTYYKSAGQSLSSYIWLYLHLHLLIF